MHIEGYSFTWNIAVVLKGSKLFIANVMNTVVKFVVQWGLIENEPSQLPR
jgi:hypothetical protein